MPRRIAYVLVWGLPLILLGGVCSSAKSTQPESGPSSAAIVAEPTVERTESDRRRSAGPPSDVVSRLIRTALQTDGSVSYRTLLQRLGPPQRVQTETIANRYVRDQVDTLRTLVYNGVEALVYDVTSEAKAFLARLSLSDARYATPEGLRVGLSEKRLTEKIGPPTRFNDEEGTLIYQETTTTPTSMVVHVQDGQVVRIDWAFYCA